MRYLKDYAGDDGIDALLLEMRLDKGRPEDLEHALALVDFIPVTTIRETLRALDLDIIDPETQSPTPGYREAWLTIQAATFRPAAGAVQGRGARG